MVYLIPHTLHILSSDLVFFILLESMLDKLDRAVYFSTHTGSTQAVLLQGAVRRRHGVLRPASSSALTAFPALRTSAPTLI